jgi:Na+/H+-dicarboxylate symporter
MIGLALGLATGLFFGELAAPLKYLGDAFIGLLQMTVLPYIVLALMGGIGKLTGAQSRLLLGRVALIILFFWFVGYLTVLLFGLSLPTLTSASFSVPAWLPNHEVSISFRCLFRLTHSAHWRKTRCQQLCYSVCCVARASSV